MSHSLLITLEYPPQKGGVANYYAGIAQHWPYGKLEVLHVKLGHMWPRWLSIFFQINSKLKTQNSKLELVKVGQVLPLGYVALLLKWCTGLPYLVYTHGMDILVPQNDWHKKLLLKYILKQAKLVVANSEFTKHEVVKLGIAASKVVVVYPCVLFEGLASASAELGFRDYTKPASRLLSHSHKPAHSGLPQTSPRAHMPAPLAPVIILTVSRLVTRKGIDTVLAALPEVIKKVPNIQYVVIGDGPDKARLTRLAAKITPPAPSYDKRGLGGVNPVLFLGAISDEQRTEWYNKASVFVLVPRPLPGDVEGFGMVYIEANSFGLPVVGSRTGGGTEAVLDGVTGLVIAPNNPHETSQALITLLTQKSLADTLGRQGRERSKNEFIWKTQLQKLSPFFSS